MKLRSQKTMHTFVKSLKLATAFTFLHLAACSSQPSLESASPIDLYKLNTWKIEGKLGVRTSDNAQSAYIHWQHDAPNYQIQVFGPFGKGKISISKEGETVTLINSDEIIEAPSAEELLYKASGLKMPLSGLEWWMKGMPAPSKHTQHNYPKATNPAYNDDGRLIQFEQLGWLVSYKRFTTERNTELPAKLILKNSEHQITLVIKKWELD